MWTIPPHELRLHLGEVHVWRIELDQTEGVVRALKPILSLDEVARADRFYSAVDGHRFLVGRASLRIILGRYLGRRADRLRFDSGPHGKPMLADPSQDVPLEFNLTHSHGLAALAVCLERRVGIDIEAIRPDRELERLVTRFFSARERAAFLEAAPERKLAAFFRTWTRKEAYIKAIGTGLSTPLESFDVGVDPDSPPGLLRVAGQPDEHDRWTMLDFDPGHPFLGSLVVEGKEWSLVGYLADVESMPAIQHF